MPRGIKNTIPMIKPFTRFFFMDEIIIKIDGESVKSPTAIIKIKDVLMYVAPFLYYKLMTTQFV